MGNHADGDDRGIQVRFYSSHIHEPPHVHVLRDDKEAKVWLQPVAPEHSGGYGPGERNRVLRLTRQHQARLLEAWYGHFRH